MNKETKLRGIIALVFTFFSIALTLVFFVLCLKDGESLLGTSVAAPMLGFTFGSMIVGFCHAFILPHSKVLIHEPLISKGFGGSATNIEKNAQRILDVKTQMNTLFAKHTGKTIDKINEATAYDHLMTAEEAISFGICDAIGSVYEGGYSI